MKKNYFLITACVLIFGSMSYGQAAKYFLDFENANPLSNLPSGVTNVNGSNTVRVKNTTDYTATPNIVQSDGSGGNELFLDYHGYLKMDLDVSNGYSIALDYRKSPEDADWYLGFLTQIGNNAGSNSIERIKIARFWEGSFDFNETESSWQGVNMDNDTHVVITVSAAGDVKIYQNNVVVLDITNATSSKNLTSWTATSLLLSFNGGSYDGTNVTPEPDYASNSRDTRAYVDNVAVFETELTTSQVAYKYANGNNATEPVDTPYGQASRFFIDFENANPLLNLPTGVTNIDGTNTVRVKNTTDYTAVSNAVQADPDALGQNELFLDFQGYLKIDIAPSTGFTLVYDYRRTNDNDDWWLGFLTFIGVDGVANRLDQLLIREWDGQLDFAGQNTGAVKPIGFNTNYNIAVTVSDIGDLKVFVDGSEVISVPNSLSGKDIHTWSSASILMSFKGDSFDGTNVTPEAEYAANARDARVFVDNIALYEGKLSASEVLDLYNNGNNTLSVKNIGRNSTKVNMYPNPVKSDIDMIKFSSKEVKSVEIYNILGVRVMTSKVTDYGVSINSLTRGTYIINCFDLEGRKLDTIKAIKL